MVDIIATEIITLWNKEITLGKDIDSIAMSLSVFYLNKKAPRAASKILSSLNSSIDYTSDNILLIIQDSLVEYMIDMAPKDGENCDCG